VFQGLRQIASIQTDLQSLSFLLQNLKIKAEVQSPNKKFRELVNIDDYFRVQRGLQQAFLEVRQSARVSGPSVRQKIFREWAKAGSLYLEGTGAGNEVGRFREHDQTFGFDK